jgi:hypothetical protein
LKEADIVRRSNSAKCSQCHFACTNVHAMERHVNRYHKRIAPYPCKQCDKTFLAEPSLIEHVRFIHQGEKAQKRPPSVYKKVYSRLDTAKHLCNCCGKLFGRRALRDHHKKVVRPYLRGKSSFFS